MSRQANVQCTWLRICLFPKQETCPAATFASMPPTPVRFRNLSLLKSNFAIFFMKTLDQVWCSIFTAKQNPRISTWRGKKTSKQSFTGQVDLLVISVRGSFQIVMSGQLTNFPHMSHCGSPQQSNKMASLLCHRGHHLSPSPKPSDNCDVDPSLSPSSCFH